jgi:hypothetical protein
MIVTPFGNMEWGKKDQVQYWLDAHDQRHHAERQEIARRGVPLYSRSFTGQMTVEWFGRHMIEHTALQDFSLPDSSVTAVLLESTWDNEATFYKWHQVHNLLHQRLDQAIGLTGRT